MRLALVAVMFFLLVPIPFLLKSTPPPHSIAPMLPDHARQVRESARRMEGSRRICSQRPWVANSGA